MTRCLLQPNRYAAHRRWAMSSAGRFTRELHAILDPIMPTIRRVWRMTRTHTTRRAADVHRGRR